MKHFYPFLVFFIFHLPLFGQAESSTHSNIMNDEEFSYQGLSWHSKKSDVKKAFPTYSESGQDLVGTNTIGKLDALHFFFFKPDLSLKTIGFSFSEEHSNKNIYIEDYNYIKQLLKQKYGEPSNEEMTWRDTLYKNDPSDYGFAVSLGDLVYTVTWELPDTTIKMVLQGDNYKIDHLLVYHSLNKEADSPSNSALDKL